MIIHFTPFATKSKFPAFRKFNKFPAKTSQELFDISVGRKLLKMMKGDFVEYPDLIKLTFCGEHLTWQD